MPERSCAFVVALTDRDACADASTPRSFDVIYDERGRAIDDSLRLVRQ